MLYLRKSQYLINRNVALRLLAGGNCKYSKDYESSDDEKNLKVSQAEKVKKEKDSPAQERTSNNEESASAKLNRLLASMETVDTHMSIEKRFDIVAKPGEAHKKKKLKLKQEVESKDIFNAARNIASLLTNEKTQQQQTESELLTRLLGGKPSADGATSHDQNANSSGGDISLSELIVGMKIDRGQKHKGSATTRSEYVRRSLAAKGNSQQYRSQLETDKERRPFQRKRETKLYTGSVNLTGGEGIGIFNDCVNLREFELLPTWSYLHEEALKVQISHPPSNYFEKVARWTEQGKVWRFPIDNEQDWLDEKDVDFTEHIFLEQHLEGWCPNRGPIRHFMELVCVGLSKNPYITAKEKKDHIMWYKNYFESKKEILGDLMSKNAEAPKTKQVEA